MRDTAENMRRKRIEDQAVKALYRSPNKPQPLFGALSSLDPDRSIQPAQSPLRSFSTVRDFAQPLSANRSPGRNSFTSALSPSRRATTPDIDRLQRRLDHAEDEILLREESCKVCGMVFIKSSPAAEDAIREHYRSHATPNPRSCPQEGCLENLEDRSLYPSHLAVIKHISGHEGLFQQCSKPGCYCPLGLLTPKQCDEHIKLHPNTSFDRTRMRESSHESLRETATRTNPTEDYEEPKPKSNDSMSHKPGEHAERLRCDKCHHIMNELSDAGRAAHAKDCKTSVENFETIMIRPDKAMFGLDQDYISSRYQKAATKRKGKATQRPTQAATDDDTSTTPPKSKGRAVRPTTKATARGSRTPQPSTLQTVAEEASTKQTAANNKAIPKASVAAAATNRSGSAAPAVASTATRATRSGSAPASLAITPNPPPAPPKRGRTPGPSTTAAAAKPKPARKPRATKAEPADARDRGTGTSIPNPAGEVSTNAAPTPAQIKTRKPRAKKAKPENDNTATAEDDADPPPPPKKRVRKTPAAKKRTEIPDSEESATKAETTEGNNDDQPAPKAATAARKPRAKAKAKGKGREVDDGAAVPFGDMDAADLGEEDGGETPAATAAAGKRKRKATVKAKEEDEGAGKRARRKK